MIKISKLADYAILVMSSIAAHPNDLLSAKDIALDTRLTETTVSKLLKILTRHQLLLSQRGVNGGYGLTRPTAQITLAEIIEAVDGKIAMTECDKTHGCCAVETHCTVSSNWQKISSAIRNVLVGISLSDMQHNIPENVIQFDFKKRITL